MTGSLTLDRIRHDLKQARYRLNIARIDGDADMAGAIEKDIARLEAGETRAEGLSPRRRHEDYHARQRRPRRRAYG